MAARSPEQRHARTLSLAWSSRALAVGGLVACVLLVVAGCAHQADPAGSSQATLAAPAIVSVDTWGGSPAASPTTPQNIRKVTLHHQGETWKPDSDVHAYLRRLQQWSRLSKRWSDIPYHYVISPNGQIHAARDVGVPGDTNTEYNPQGHALVMLMGNFEEVQPTPQQLQASVELVAWLLQRHQLPVSAIASHKDYSQHTLCPGKNFYELLASGWFERATLARLNGQAPLAPPITERSALTTFDTVATRASEASTSTRLALRLPKQ